jgi:hypothetical protein
MAESLNAIWLGSASGEFQRPFELLQQRAHIRLCSDLSTLSHWASLTNLTPPELVFGASAWPGSWNATSLEQISRQWPLTRWVELVGAWSQGAARTAPSWFGWQQFPASELEFSLDQIFAASSTPLPRTVTREERLLHRLPSALRQGTRVGVFSRQRNQILPLLELLESLGCFGVGHWEQAADLELGDEDSWREFSPEALVVNLSTELAAALPWLLAIRSRWPMVPLVMVADVPRIQEIELAHAHDLGPLLGKPVDVACLATALQSVLSVSKRMVH